jgi:outer membrane protein assembly factor BamB
MASSIHGRFLLLVTLIGLAPGCAQVQSVGSLFSRQRSELPEKVFSVSWWTKADESFVQPYQPVETGAPESDPQSGLAFAATADGKVRAYADQGRYLWEYDAQGPFNAGPTFSDGKLYLATSKGRLVALEAATGRQIWAYIATDELLTRPVIAGGLVLVMSASDTLFAVDQATGEWKWQYRREQSSEFTIRGTARPLSLEGRVYAGFADGNAVALDLADGSVQWTKDLGGGKAFADVDADPVADDFGRVYFASYATGLFALDGQSGAVVWTYSQPAVTALYVDAATRRVFAGGNGFLVGLAPDSGDLRWKLSLGERFVSGLSLTNGLLLAATGPGPLLFVDSSSGRLRRSFDPGRGIWATPTVHDSGQALVLSNRGYLYNLQIEAWGRP